jgi:hypothetical protein
VSVMVGVLMYINLLYYSMNSIYSLRVLQVYCIVHSLLFLYCSIVYFCSAVSYTSLYLIMVTLISVTRVDITFKTHFQTAKCNFNDGYIICINQLSFSTNNCIYCVCLRCFFYVYDCSLLIVV